MKIARKCIARTLTFFMSAVSSSNSFSILSSTTSVFVVVAPVMPSLKAPVMREVFSRTCRWKNTSFFWKYMDEIATIGTITSTHSAIFQLRMSIITMAHTRYAECHTPSAMLQASVLAMRSVSDMTRAWT